MNFYQSWLCRNTFHNGAIYRLRIHESTIHRIFVAYLISNLITATQTFSILSNPYTGKALVWISLIEMGLMFSKTLPGSISEFDVISWI